MMKSLCELTHLEALAALRTAEREVARLRVLVRSLTPPTRCNMVPKQDCDCLNDCGDDLPGGMYRPQ